jgi:DnaD/phage-associated family protein
MNYIKELNAFRDWLLVNNLTSSAILLWHTLMTLNNASGWKKQFNAPTPVVQQLTGMSKQSIANARQQLLEHKLIRYEPGKKGTAPIYEMISFIDESTTQNVDQPIDKKSTNSSLFDSSIDQKVDQTLTIHKQKQKENINAAAAADPFRFYEKNFGNLNPFVKESITDWCEKIGEELVVAGMQLALKKGGRTFKYVERILEEWHLAKIETLEQLREYQLQKDKKLQGNNAKTDLFEKLRREES